MTAQWVMYGIKNCDTIKKARKALEAANIDYVFHDYRVDGLDDALLHALVEQVGHEALLNTRGTTWRKLPEEARDAAQSAAGARALMLAHPAIIKRPVLAAPNGTLLVGFDAARYHTFIQEND
ncbi:ArsC family reductase [Pantoea sp. Mb-10]|uniref:ArsC family reductase n=1 Tax=unclassified Pantoea TaxID=2630326 RepID=UPI001E30C225|nr:MULTISPECIES: ArsC family reductase [unclassified Pantoea]MCE0489233.1 ArsC family reductase [Pantoea sp. Mb-10]MCE0503018.1 ArsC family reductase [Pantoea sp. Pb-8]